MIKLNLKSLNSNILGLFMVSIFLLCSADSQAQFATSVTDVADGLPLDPNMNTNGFIPTAALGVGPFDGACGPVSAPEMFENPTMGGIYQCGVPLNSTTNDGSAGTCFAAIANADFSFSVSGGNDLAVVPAGSFGAPSTCFGVNTFVETAIITFPNNNVTGIQWDHYDQISTAFGSGGANYTITAIGYDCATNSFGAMLGSVNIVGNGTTQMGISVTSPNDFITSITVQGAGSAFESFDNVEIATCPLVSCAPVASQCVLTCPDDFTIELEPGECQEVVFFEPMLSESCGGIETTTIFGGSFAGGPGTDNGDNVEATSLPVGSTVYTFAAPACSTQIGVTFDWTYETDQSPFWDPFTLSGPNGTIASFTGFTGATMEAGSVCEQVPGGSMYEANLNSINAIGTATFTLSNYEAVCLIGGAYTVTQTSGPLTGEYIGPGDYCVTYEATDQMYDPATCELTPGMDVLDCEFCFTINEYTGPVTTVLACNDGINVSLDENCQALITADMILEGGPYGCYEDYVVTTSFGSPLITNCGTYTVTVTDPVTGNSCWGTVTTEDKLPPFFEVIDFDVTCLEAVKIPELLVPEFDANFIEVVSGPVLVGVDDTGAEVPTTEDFTFDVPCDSGGCTITDLNVYVNLTHSWIGDLDIIVTAPDGTSNDLIGFGGCFNQEWVIDGTFDEECAFNNLTMCADFDQMGAGCFWAAGLFGSLSTFNGVDACGTWTVTVADNTNGDDGIVNSIALLFNNGAGDCSIAAVEPGDILGGSACGAVSIDYVDWEDTSLCGENVITRTWTAVDAKGNSHSEEQIITITPIGISDLTVPPAVIVLNACSADLSPEALAIAFDDPATRDDTTNGTSNCNPPVGPTEECEEFNEGYAFAYPHYFLTSPCSGDILHAQKVDNNVCNIYATYSDIVIEACGDKECGGASGNKVIRTWTLLDWCLSAAGAPPSESTVEYTQVIKVVDLEAPTVTGNDLTVSTNPWGCTATFPIPAPQLHDNCDGTITWSFHGPAGTQTIDSNDDGIDDTVIGAPVGVHTFTYTAEDCCGNVGTFDITVTVVDSTPPVAIGRENIVVSLSGSGSSSDGFAKIFTHHVDLNSFDGCSDVHLEIKRDSDNCARRGNTTYNADNHECDGSSNPNSPLFDDDNGEFVTFCCADAGDTIKVWLRVWDDGDGDGLFGTDGDNYNETWVHVLVEDKGNPVIYCPPDFTITCGWEWGQYDDAGNLISTNTGAASASAICDDLPVVADVNDRTNDCGVGDVEIEWCTVPAGNESPVCCEQVITITEGDSAWDADDIDFQNGRVLDCRDIPEPEMPEWGEGLCDLIAWTSEDLQLYFEEDACYKVIRTYTVVNWCTDEVIEEKVVFTVLDETAPIIECGEDMYGIFGTGVGSNGGPGSCSLENLTLTKTATDGGSDCSSAWLEWKVEVDLWGDGTVDYTWSFAEGADENFREDRDDDMDGIYYLAKDTTVTITIPEAINHSCYTHTITWQVNDGCNNYSSCTDEFMVVDKKAPTPFCVDLGTAIMENGSVEVWAIDFDLGAFDNCTESDHLRFTFTDELPPADSDLWNEEGNSTALEFNNCGEVPLQIYVWDRACEPNFEYCDVTLLISGNECDGDSGMRMISGSVETEEGESISNAEMSVTTDAMNNYDLEDMTDDIGYYAFTSNPMHLDYQLSGTKTDDYMNGVSTLDLVLIQKHILQTQLLDSPYKMIAADINRSGSISAIDLVQLRKLILGVYSELPNNASWRFADANQTLDISNPWIFTETINVNDLDSHMMSEDFVGVKIGDVNGSVTANATSINTENRSGSTLLLEIEDKEVKAGEAVAIELMSSNYTDVAGYQFTLNVEGLDVTDVQGAKLELNNGNVAMDKGVMTMSYHSSNLQSAAKTEVLFTINVIAQRAGSLSEMLHINSSVTNAEAYFTNELEVADVKLGVRTDGAVELVGGYELYQNEPNPFNGVTQIGFRLPAASTATITVYDVTGKVVKTATSDYAKGYNTIVISKQDLGTSAGLLYYQLESGDFTATKKMIVIE